MEFLRKLRLSARQTERTDEPPKSDELREPASGTSLLGDINQISETWFKHRWFEAARAPTSVCSPEELVMSAGDRKIDVSYAQRRVTSLKIHEFPCVILNRNGESTILTGWHGWGEFNCQINGKKERRKVRDVQRDHSGIIFFVRPKDPAAHDAASPTAWEEKKPADIYGLVKQELFGVHKYKFLELCACAALSNLFLLALPIFSMTVYDRVVPHFAMETLWALSIGVAITIAFDFLLRAIRIKLTDAIGLNTSTLIQSRLYARILKAKAGEVPNGDHGLQAGMREIESLSQVVPAFFVSLIVDVPFFVLTSVLLFSIGTSIVLVPIFAVLLIGAVQIFGDVKAEKAALASRVAATQSNLLLETTRNIETVKVTNAALPLVRRWERIVDSGAYASHANRLHAAMTGIAAMSISQFAVVCTIVLGVYSISAGQMSLGALSACTLLVGRMMSPISQIGFHMHRLVQFKRSARAVELVLNAEQEAAGDPTSSRLPLKGQIRFSGVAFTYPGEQSPALQDVNLRIGPNERVGLIGGAGSGKSTLLRLIVRLLDPSEGALLIDDRDIRQCDPNRLRRHFGFMSQDAKLFDDTLRHAVCFGLDHVPDADFLHATQISGVADFAARHPLGYSMRIGPRGERVSGGERQSIMLARALLTSPPCLILDEPTASMDNTMEMKIVSDLRTSLGERSLIIATHRAPLIALVNRLIWLDRGRIIADGPKDEVLKMLSQRQAS